MAEAVEALDELIANLKRPPRIVIVEDDETSMMLCSTMLRELGCTHIQEARTIQQATASAGDADLILLDVKFAGNGASVLKYIEERKIGATVVLVTAYEGHELKELLRGAKGYARVITKPLSLEAVDDMLADHFASRFTRPGTAST